jgi:hypothetical protein
MKNITRFAVFAICFSLFISSCTKEEDDDTNYQNAKGRFSDDLSCTIIAPPASVNLNMFYKKYLNCKGVPIVTSNLSSDAALYRADTIMNFLLVGRDDVRKAMIENDLMLAIMGDGEVTTDIPEFAYKVNDNTRNWTTEPIGRYEKDNNRHIAIVSEANLMCLPSDLYLFRPEELTVHEFFHPVDAGLRFINSTYRSEVIAAYNNAKANGLWANTYAISNDSEYMAEVIQVYYNSNPIGLTSSDGIHNEVDSREKLKSYDPQVYAILEKYFNPSLNVPGCN